MLVEDDNSLREIYEARLAAEGYEVVSAKDGEEALATALKERPDLIIADVMMPRVSGFDMLDILRSTPETKNTKIIIMTALSQAEDQQRAEKLGADRYLVKSQVTLEDVTREARAIIDKMEQEASATVAKAEGVQTPAPAAQTPVPPPAPAPTPKPEPEAAEKEKSEAPKPASGKSTAQPVSTPDPAPATNPEPKAAAKPAITSIPVTAAPDDSDAPDPDNPTETKDKQPPPAKPKPAAKPVPAAKKTEKENPKTSGDKTPVPPVKNAKESALEKNAQKLSKPTREEASEVQEQVDEFIASNPTLSTSPDSPGSDDSSSSPTSDDADTDEKTNASSAAADAVDSLTKPAQVSDEDSTNDNDTKSSKSKTDESGRSYVGQGQEGDGPKPGGSSGLEHTKRIEPTPEALRNGNKPDLNTLLAKEGESSDDSGTPAVNSVIDPNNTGGAAPTN